MFALQPVLWYCFSVIACHTYGFVLGGPMEQTTERQRRILEVIREFTAERGYPPSVREIGERVGLSSSSTIHAHLKTLERRGFITRDPTKPRALRSEVQPSGSPVPETVVMPVIGKVAAG